MQDVLKQIKPQVQANVDAVYEVANLIAQSLKNAPQGSEAAVAAFKQAVEAGNNAVAQARKSAKQVAEIAKQNVEQVKGNVVSAKPAARRRRA